MAKRYYEIQDGKYVWDNKEKCLVNRATKKPIPKEEPIFILRGQDRQTVGTLFTYRMRVQNKNKELAAGVQQRIDEFVKFTADNPDVVKDPD